MDTQIFFTPPPDFHPTIEVAGCYCLYKDQFLLLLRQPEKPQGNTWGIPAGKLESGEKPAAAVIREVFEEVGLDVREELQFFRTLYARIPKIDYTFHIFWKNFAEIPEILLEKNEHTEARWVTVDEAVRLPLMMGAENILRLFWSEFSNRQ